jgi:N-methylhydantoinase A
VGEITAIQYAATVAIDTGGTFTDIVLAAGGRAYVCKIPSTPSDPAAAALSGLQQILRQHQFSTCALLIHGSTVATNALLERKGARVALITNRGFEDVIEIGRQNRPQLYALTGTRPPPLVERALRFGIGGRLDHEGRELAALHDSELRELPALLADADAIAICLLHCYANPKHELAVADACQRAGIAHVSRSSELLPEYREYERTATTVVNAYVLPLMASYLSRIEHESATQVRIMGSGGGALSVARARREPVHTVLSGPAGGVAGALAVARAAGFDNIITFDMGGTSTDVALCPGRPLYTRELQVAGVPVALPVLDIHTVGAGGGSLAWLDAGGALRVGPRSAGAAPGPICYGHGGEQVTVTDANVWLGRLPVSSFLGGAQLLDRGAIEAPLSELARRMGGSLETAALGVLTVVDNTMAGALRVISVERGHDPADFTVVAFGGAAGLHAARLAASIGAARVLIPPQPGLLSAFGMLVSPVRKATARTVLLRDDAVTASHLEEVFQALEAAALADMRSENVPLDAVTLDRYIDARYAGQSHELRVAAANWVENLHHAHETRYGYSNRASVAEAVTLRVDAYTAAPAMPAFETPDVAAAETVAQVYDGSDWRAVRIIPRSAVVQPVEGPAVITEYSATTWVPVGWRAERLEAGALILGRDKP